MFRPPSSFAAWVAFFLLIGSETSRSAEHFREAWEICACKGQLNRDRDSDPDSPSAGNGRKYARSREIDLRHLRLEVTPDFTNRTLSGIATLTFSPIATPLVELRLDAVDLAITAVEATVPVKTWDVGKENLTVTFTDPIPADREVSLTVTYSAAPQEGWYYRTEAMGYPKGDDHFWTQGEPEYHRYWFPGYDYPNERFTSEVLCRVPRGMTVISNGRLIEQGQEGDLTLFHWSQEQEHVNYLVSIIGGFFKKLESKHGELPIAFLTPPSEFAVAENSFRDTAAILAFFDGETGVKFPWAKYYSTCVTDFTAGGMENTSATTLTSGTLFSAASENLYSSHRLDAHEAAHQWFGDLVTCKDWSHLWLNEGFATYYTHLYDEHKSGTDEMRYGLLKDARKILADSDEKPIVWRAYKDPMEQFDYRAYPKGSWALHMIRSQIGAELFRKSITTYLERHRNGNVETQDLLAVFEETTGRSWDEFFDQWIYHGGEPALKVAYAWDEGRHQAKLAVQQTQKTSDKVLLFDFPLPVRFIDETGAIRNETVRVHETSEDFYFDLPAKPKIVRIDPELTVLASIDFTPANPLIHAQLENGADAIGRLLAATALGGKKDQENIDRLKKVLTDDPFYGVRIEAAAALNKTHTPEALTALVSSLAQEDARVREAVIKAVGGYYSEASFAALRDLAKTETNPDLVADALAFLGKYPDPEVAPLLLASLERTSYRHRVASAAIRAMKDQGSEAFVEPVRGHLEGNEALFPSADFGSALDALAALARFQEDASREETRRFLAGYLGHPKEVVREAAIKALGTLGDPAAIVVLKTFTEADNPDLREGKAAAAAIQKLNADKVQADEVKDLRKEVLEMQEGWKSLREELETLKKQSEAVGKEAAAKLEAK